MWKRIKNWVFGQDIKQNGDIGVYGLKRRLDQVYGNLSLLRLRADRQKDMDLLHVVTKSIGV